MSNNLAKLSREDYRKQKDLEAARKAGTAPAELDEEGNEINPHIPQYISKAPWYLDTGGPGLKHQRPQKEERLAGFEYLNKGATGPAATKYRKGACENCGASSHKTKECVDRPRKKGAKFTGKDIKPDEVVPELGLDFESKRDRWNGYDPKEHDKLFEVYDMVNEARKKLKAQELDNAAALGTSSTQALKKVVDPGNIEYGSSDDSDEEEDKYAEKSDMPGQKVDTKSRTTIRNLRIREDRAKYLYNLDLDSAYYDPKTRSMRDNPFEGKPPEELPFAGDNFVRQSKDAQKIAELQLFSWEESEKGNDALHLQANPTQYELYYKEHLKKKETIKESTRQSILEKYGGTEHLEAPDKDLLLAQSEHYVEYSRTGHVIKGQERAIPRSKYEEDVFSQNHTSVWGSFWAEGRWGYRCCRSHYRNAYCIPVDQ
ncbi:mRNA splicing protein [Entomophthora muscae]|uniref:mRNA splicing protein n=2 Tax=Entomophthora muscae TaxID=34485 RepID=A0ACC2TQ65_9FUNG|nr:mRNA splicing protein [Entomophthora muscae]KAJ9090083.1 mRNA splicing protein [Entomophthora muscae]